MTKNDILSLCCQLSHELHKGYTDGVAAVDALETADDEDALYSVVLGEMERNYTTAKDLLYKIQTAVAMLPDNEVELYA